MFLRVFGVVVICFHLFFALPTGVNAQNNNEKRVGVFVFRLADSYINLVTQAIQKSLAGKVDVMVFDAKQDQVLQLDQLTQFINGGGDAVAMNLVDVKVGQDVLSVIREKNIPVIFFNKEPDLELILDYKQARYVGSEARQSGVLQGEIIAKIWKSSQSFDRNNDNICNFIMLQGNIDNPEALVRSKLSVQQARKLGVNMQQVGNTLICDWDEECAYSATKTLLNSHLGKVDMIIANNDSMALGAIKALQDYNFNVGNNENIIPVVGIDGLKQAKEAIAKGLMHGTVIQDADAMGYAIASMILNSLNGKKFLDNLPYSWGDSSIDIRIPYKEYTE